MNKKALINIDNRDNYCFLYALLIQKYPDPPNRHNRDSYYKQYLKKSTKIKVDSDGNEIVRKFLVEFEVTNLSFPINKYQISQFCDMNKKISVNIFYYDSMKDSFGFEFKSGKRRDFHADLLMLEDDDGENFHFSLIKDLSRLISSQINSNKRKKYFCRECLLFFSLEATYKSHIEHSICANTKMEFPPESKGNLEFRNHTKSLDCSLCIYFDFESLLRPSNLESESGNLRI